MNLEIKAAEKVAKSNVLIICPSKLSGVLNVPSSKSLTHRAIIAAALCYGTCVLKKVLLSADVLETLNAVKALGVKWKLFNGTLFVFGSLLEEQEKNRGEIKIKCLESASTVRFLAPVVAALGFNVKFVVGKRLFERICVCGEFLLQKEGFCCFKVAKNLEPGCFCFENCLTSQFISGLLLILPVLKKNSLILFKEAPESKNFLSLTVAFLNDIGIKIKKLENGFEIPANQVYRPFSCSLEGDFSLASFFAIAGCFNEIKLCGFNFNSLQGELKIVEILKFCGVDVQFSKENDLIVRPSGSALKHLELNLKNNIDLAPVLAVLASFCSGTSILHGVARLKFKESNRINSILELINGLGGRACFFDNCLKIEGVGRFKGGVVNCFADHRIAMAATVASCACKSNIVLNGAGCVAKSWPGFFESFKKLGGALSGFSLE